jgi:GT2 family glycosyltransferase
MRLSVVLVNWNSRDDLLACLTSLRSQTHRDLEIIVVDNGSHDGSADMVAQQFPEVRLLRETENLGFAEACNRGIDASSGEWVAMLNNDTVAEPDWAKSVVMAAESCEPTCGMLQSLLLYQDRPGTINSTGVELTRSGGGRDRDEGKPRSAGLEPAEIFCPTAGAAAYRRSMLNALRLPEGYFDRCHFMYYEDMDLGWRARLGGWSTQYVPSSVVLHKWHGSSNRHGRSWLVVIAHTNRVRTLCKNASVPFLLRTAPQSFRDFFKILRHGRLGAVRSLLTATRKSLTQRKLVTGLARVDRRAVERAWVAK